MTYSTAVPKPNGSEDEYEDESASACNTRIAAVVSGSDRVQGWRVPIW